MQEQITIPSKRRAFLKETVLRTTTASTALVSGCIEPSKEKRQNRYGMGQVQELRRFKGPTVKIWLSGFTLSAVLIMFFGPAAWGQDEDTAKDKRIKSLEERVQKLEQQLQEKKKAEKEAEPEETDDSALNKRVRQLERLFDDWQRQDTERMDISDKVKIDIGGQYRVMANTSNFSFHPESIRHDEKTRSFFNQRFRTWLDIEASKNVGAYLQLEMGHILWGEDYEFPKTYDAGGDEVGVEFRRGYIWYDREDIGKFRVGIQDWSDAFGDVLASSEHDFNVGGVSYLRRFESLGNVELKMGGFLLTGGADDTSAGDDATLFTLDATWPIAEKSNFGVSAYYLNDKGSYSYGTFGGPETTYKASEDLWLGVRGQAALGKVELLPFFIYNTGGTDSPDWGHAGFATGGKAFYDLGFGKLGFLSMYSSGDDDPTDDSSNEFRTIAQSSRNNFGAFGYWNFLGLASPRGSSDVQDLGVSLQNRGLGLFTVQTNLEVPLTKTLTGYLATGWLSSTEDNPDNGEKNMGIEVLGDVRIDLGAGLTLDLGAAYLFTGDFYEEPGSGDPENLFELFSRFQLEF